MSRLTALRFQICSLGVRMKDESPVEVDTRDVKPDGGYGWVVCCGTFIVNFVVFGIHNSFGVVYVNLLDDLKLGEMQTGK